MGSIFVILNKQGNLDLHTIVNKAMTMVKNGSPDYSNISISFPVGLGCHIWFTTTESKKEKLPYQYTNSRCWITADARIDNRNELSRKLGIKWESAKKFTDSQFILLSYLKWGEGCVQHLYGDFAFAIWDENRNELLCGRDHFGCRPLYYVDQPEYIAFSSNPEGFQALPDFDLLLDEIDIVDRICSIIPNKEISSFKNVYRLEPAHYLKISPERILKKVHYWDLEIQDQFSVISENDAIQGIRELFINAVRQRSRSTRPLGVELSGGLDSSSITSCLINNTETIFPVFAFTHSASNRKDIKQYIYGDEIEFSKKIVERNGIKRHFLITGDDQDGSYSALIKFLTNRKKPLGQSYTMFSDLLYEQANQSGIRILLSGFGGDEGVTYKGGGILEEFASKGEFEKLRQTIKSKNKNNLYCFQFEFIKQYIKIITPWLVRWLKKDWRKSRYKIFAINRDLRKRYRMKKRYFKRVFIPNDPDVRRRQYKRIMHPHVSDRLEDSYFAAQEHGLEYRYPFLDVKLIEFYYSLPSEFKYKDGIGRYIFRKAMEGIIQDEIRLRNDKAEAAIPNILYRTVKDEALFRRIIQEGRIKNRFHYVDYEKLYWMLDQFKYRDKKKINFGLRAFLSPISILILQKWQREGRINIGIKC